MPKHDKISNRGFNVEPEVLAHSLAILKLSKMPSLTGNSVSEVYYDTYLEVLEDFTVLIDDRIRYDSNFDK